MPAEYSGEAFEFICTDCGRFIVQIAGPANEFHLCALCMMLPGWYRVAELRERFGYGDDPDAAADAGRPP
jgi:hypothetical protein